MFCLFLENTSSNKQITTKMASKAHRFERTEALINSWRDEKSLWGRNVKMRDSDKKRLNLLDSVNRRSHPINLNSQ